VFSFEDRPLGLHRSASTVVNARFFCKLLAKAIMKTMRLKLQLFAGGKGGIQV